MAHINTLYPAIFKEVSDLYESLKYLYPSKRNLMKTELYIKQYAPGQNTTMQHLDMQNFDLQHTDEPTTVQNTYTESETQSESTKPKTRRDVEPSLKIQLIENPQVPIVNEDQTEKLLQETYELISEAATRPRAEMLFFYNTRWDDKQYNPNISRWGKWFYDHWSRNRSNNTRGIWPAWCWSAQHYMRRWRTITSYQHVRTVLYVNNMHS